MTPTLKDTLQHSLDAVDKGIAAFSRAKQHTGAEKVAQAKAAVAPSVAQAKVMLKTLAGFAKEHGPLLERLRTLDLEKLRGRVDVGLIERLGNKKQALLDHLHGATRQLEESVKRAEGITETLLNADPSHTKGIIADIQGIVRGGAYHEELLVQVSEGLTALATDTERAAAEYAGVRVQSVPRDMEAEGQPSKRGATNFDPFSYDTKE